MELDFGFLTLELNINQYVLTDTSNLIKESRRIVDASSDNTVLNMILEIVTNIDNRVKQMESKIDKRLEELKQAYLSVSVKVRTLENND